MVDLVEAFWLIMFYVLGMRRSEVMLACSSRVEVKNQRALS